MLLVMYMVKANDYARRTADAENILKHLGIDVYDITEFEFHTLPARGAWASPYDNTSIVRIRGPIVKPLARYFSEASKSQELDPLSGFRILYEHIKCRTCTDCFRVEYNRVMGFLSPSVVVF